MCVQKTKLYIYYTILLLIYNGPFTGELNKREPRFTGASGGPTWEAQGYDVLQSW